MSSDKDMLVIGPKHDRYECWKHGEDEPGIFIWDGRTDLPVAICRQCWLEDLLNRMDPMRRIEHDKVAEKTDT